MTATATTPRQITDNMLASKTSVRTEYRIFGIDADGTEFLSAAMPADRAARECEGRTSALPEWTFRVVARIVTESVAYVAV